MITRLLRMLETESAACSSVRHARRKRTREQFQIAVQRIETLEPLCLLSGLSVEADFQDFFDNLNSDGDPTNDQIPQSTPPRMTISELIDNDGPDDGRILEPRPSFTGTIFITGRAAGTAIPNPSGLRSTSVTIAEDGNLSNVFASTTLGEFISDVDLAGIGNGITVGFDYFTLALTSDLPADATTNLVLILSRGGRTAISNSFAVTRDPVPMGPPPDTVAPTLTSFTRNTLAGAPTNADALVFQATFSEGVQNVDTSDFTVNGTTTASVTNVSVVSGSVYNLTVSGGDLADFDGSVSLDLAGGQDITDTAGNALPDIEPAIDEVFFLDNTVPTPVIAGPDSPSRDDPFDVTIDFGEAVTGFVNGDITVGNGAVTSFADNGSGSFTATIDATSNGEVTVDVAGGAATDSAGNTSNAATQFTVNIQTLTVRVDGPGSAVTEGADAVFTVSLSEASVNPVSVALSLDDGTATLAGDGMIGDFDPITTAGLAVAVQFEPGETSKTVTVSTNQDGIVEPDEDFTLSIIGVSGAGTEDDGDMALAIIDGTELGIAPISDQTIAADAGTIDLRVASVTTDAIPATLTTSSLPAFVSFTDHGDGTGTFTFTPTASDIGDADLTVTAAGSSGSVDSTFNVNVVAADVVETIETIRINSAGGTVAAPGGAFLSDRFFNTGNRFSTDAIIDVSDGSLPAGTPASIFQTTRWDAAGGAELRYSVPVDPGEYLVRLYFAEIYGPAARVNGRVFDVSIEGILELDNFDVFASAGAANKGIAREFTVMSDGSLDIDFGHVVENPDVMAIEIVSTRSTVNSGPQIAAVADQGVDVASSTTVAVSATDADGDVISLTASGLPDFASFTDHGNGTGSIAVTPGAADTGEYLITVQASSGSQPLTDSTSFTLSVTAPISEDDSPLAGSAGDAITSGTPTSTEPTVSITGPADPVTEGDDAVFTVTLSNPFDQQIGVGVVLVDGDATLVDGDFAPIVPPDVIAVIPFEPGEISKDVSITTLLDGRTEPAETFSLTIPGAFYEGGELTVTTPSATATIDGATLSVSPVADQTISAGTGPVDIIVAAASSDGSPATLSANGLPTFGSFIDNDDGTGTLVFSPTSADIGTSTIEIISTDSSGSVMTSFDLDVVATEFIEQAASVFRINAGGGAVGSFSGDRFANTGNRFSTRATIDLSDPSVPAGTPAVLFQTTRWAPASGSGLSYNIPTGPGEFEVLLYFAEIYGPTSRVGGRVFDVSLESQTVLDNFDVFATAGAANRAIVERFNVTSDGVLNIDFRHEIENPDVMAIEVINRTPIANTGPTLNSIPRQSVNEGEILVIPVMAIDSNEDDIILSASDLPSFASFIDNGNGTGTLRLEPQIGDDGKLAVTINAESGSQSLTDSTAFELAVNQIIGGDLL